MAADDVGRADSESPCVNGPPVAEPDAWRFVPVPAPTEFIQLLDWTSGQVLLSGDPDGDVWLGTPRSAEWTSGLNWTVVIPLLIGSVVATSGPLVALAAYDPTTLEHFVLVSGYSGGATWQEVYASSAGSVSSLLFSPGPGDPASDPVLYLGGLYDGAEGFRISRDLGDTWEFYGWGLSDDLFIPWTIAESPVTGTLVVGGEIADHPEPYPRNGRPPLLRSTDGGMTWDNVHPSSMWHATAVVFSHDGADVYAQEEGGSIWTSRNDGRTWTRGPFSGFENLFIDPLTECLFGATSTYLGSPGGLYVSCDRGRYFEPVGLVGEAVHFLAFNEAGSRVYVAGYGSGLWAADVPRACE